MGWKRNGFQPVTYLYGAFYFSEFRFRIQPVYPKSENLNGIIFDVSLYTTLFLLCLSYKD